jgi:hypothetical protein
VELTLETASIEYVVQRVEIGTQFEFGNPGVGCSISASRGVTSAAAPSNARAWAQSEFTGPHPRANHPLLLSHHSASALPAGGLNL